MKAVRCSVVMVLSLLFGQMLQAGLVLDLAKAKKVEVRHSMMGYRNTLLFYTFEDKGAVVKVVIGNKDESFPVTAKVHLFDPEDGKEGLKKWINNQHSDALFIDAAKPILIAELPKGICKVTSKKKTGESENPGPMKGAYKDFEVNLVFKEHELEKNFKLVAFTDTAKVHIKGK